MQNAIKQKEHVEAQRTKALIYCRVSSAKQKTDGHGLDSQEQRCRQYAALKNYSVEAVFPDDATGGWGLHASPRHGSAAEPS